MTLLLAGASLLVLFVAVLVGIDAAATARLRAFATKKEARFLDGKAARDAALEATVAGSVLQVHNARFRQGRDQSVLRTTLTLDQRPGVVALLRRRRGRWVEWSLSSVPQGMKREALPEALANEYELWLAAGMSGSARPTVLDAPEIQKLLAGFWRLTEVRWLGQQLAVVYDGDPGHVDRLERAWALLEHLAQLARR